MGAPATATKKRKRPAAKGPTPPTIGAGDSESFTEEDMERLSTEVDDAVQFDGSPIGPDGEIRPVEIGRSGKAGPEMVHIFTLEGEKFFIPKRPSPAIMLRFMRDVRDKRVGQDLAIENAMLTLLGKRALDALSDSPETTDDDMANVFVIVGVILFGAIKAWRKATDPSLRALSS